jgi:hypothetical protein
MTATFLKEKKQLFVPCLFWNDQEVTFVQQYWRNIVETVTKYFPTMSL